MKFIVRLILTAVLGLSSQLGHTQTNLVPDPSIEESQPPNQFGIPYKRWSGWLFEGAGTFRNGRVAHSGATSAELLGTPGVKMRLNGPTVMVTPGRYRFVCYIRGLDVGAHAWGLSEDVNFADETYYPLKKTGSFGWTRLEIVKDVPIAKSVDFHIGLWASGRLWIDDASIEPVSATVPISTAPLLGTEEASIKPPGALDPVAAVHCADCGYLNMPSWPRCYACGAPIDAHATRNDQPVVRQLASFESGAIAPFTSSQSESAAVVREHATDGKSALQLKSGYIVWDGPQDWSGYDFIKADTFNSGDAPVQFSVEIHDRASNGYWTRVNYQTVLPPGASTLIVPTDLYVGEKSRPGRALDKAHIIRFVLILEDKKPAVFIDNIRLERDVSDKVKVPGLRAFSFGPGTSPPLRGFTQVTPATVYSPGRGYGFKDARIWKAYDALQPDPLYQVGICIEGGGFAVDLPNGKYHVFLNIDSPSGFWGEYQVYRKRTVKANGATVVSDTMNLSQFLDRYFRFADVEDSLAENTFDKYQLQYFHEKEFDVEVQNKQLVLDFEGEVWANYLSALVIYPASAADGKRYLANLRERRRFYFDNYFKRIPPEGKRDVRGAIPPFEPTTAESARGWVTFRRDWMQDVPVNAVPRRDEVGSPIVGFSSAGKMTPMVFSIFPIADKAPVTVSVSDLTSSTGATIPAAAIQLGIVSHRLTRVTGEGTVYTIAPRFIMPRSTAPIKKGTTVTFWLTLHTPMRVTAGSYTAKITLKSTDGQSETIPVSMRIFATPLDPLDVPAGPWGSSLSLPWYASDLGDYDREMFKKSLAKMREYGCTTFSGIPTIRISEWKDRKPIIDFTQADREMADALSAGFTKVVVNYNGGIGGFDNYHFDVAAMKAAGFTDYVAFLRAVLTVVGDHAKAANWLPVAYNLCDEPQSDDAKIAAENARAWRQAAPAGMLTTGATSVQSPAPDDPHLALAKALRAPNLNGHDDAAITAIKGAGNEWAFYNGGNRWTFGTYMFKCAKEYGMAFRLSWHWNVAAGDPYYALDSREDDYAWVATNAHRDLIPTIHFERDIREGIDDYRYMLTLSRLISAKPNHPAAAGARKLVTDKLSAFKLGERDHEAKWPVSEYYDYRLKLAEAIEAMSR